MQLFAKFEKVLWSGFRATLNVRTFGNNAAERGKTFSMESHATRAKCGKIYSLHKARENTAARVEPGETCNPCLARENCNKRREARITQVAIALSFASN